MSNGTCELNDKQIARVDEVENAVYELCKLLTEDKDLKWDMYYIGEIADMAADILTKQGHKVRYPAIVEGGDGNEYVEEYYG